MLLLVYDLKSVGALEIKSIAPIPEQRIWNRYCMKVPINGSDLFCIKIEKGTRPVLILANHRHTTETVGIPICSGMGATNFNFWALRS